MALRLFFFTLVAVFIFVRKRQLLKRFMAALFRLMRRVLAAVF